jgi:hypothetical protein
MPDEGPIAEPPTEDEGSSHWVRPVASWVLAVLASVAIAAAVLAVWIHETVLNTDNFVEVVAPALESEAVQAATADYLSEQVITALDLENRIETTITGVGDQLTDAIADALELGPAQRARLENLDLGLADLAGPISFGLESRITDRITEFVSAPETTELLIRLVTVAHERTVFLLREELNELPNIVISDGEVRLNLVPLVAAAIRSLVDDGVEVGAEGEVPLVEPDAAPDEAVSRLAAAIGALLPSDFGQVQLMTTDRLEELQDYLRTLDRLVWAIVIVAIGLAIAAVATAPSISNGVVRVAAGGAIGLVVGLLAIQAVAAWLSGAVAEGTATEAIQEVTGTLVASLQPLVIVLAIVGFGAAIAAHIVQQRSQPSAEAAEG